VTADPHQDLGELVARLSGDERLDKRALGRLLARLAAALALTSKGASTIGLTGARLLVDVVVDVAPRIPVRDLPTLRAHHDGLSGEALADALVGAAAKATGAVGAAGGALAAVEYVAPPTLLSAPVQIAAETVAVVAIEVKLVAELHEVYGVHIVGSPTERGAAYLSAWSHRRGVDPRRLGTLPALITGAARRQLRQRLVRRLARNASTMGPLLTGAVAGASLNRRETHRLGAAIRDDLRKRVLLR
jgi:hypothetical protein